MRMPLAAGRVHLKKENWVVKGTAMISKGRHVVLQSGSLQPVTSLLHGVNVPLACLRCPVNVSRSRLMVLFPVCRRTSESCR